ncbi:MAG: glycosyltransferase family 39 protein [Candidatus Omnitrophica bacterium]|nr:glycosyltransferase family 39 protein [Candidatus Omnitrophota bacterium]
MKLKYLIIPIMIYYACFLFHESCLRADSARYFVLGRSIANGTGYVDEYLPEPKPAHVCPPGYAFLLSIVIKIFGANIVLLRMLTVIFSGLSLLVLIGILNKYLDSKEVAAVFLLFALNPLFLNYAHALMSEAGYILFSWIAIYIFLAWEDSLSAPKVLLGALIVIISFYIRTVGAILFLSLFIYLLMRRKYTYAMLFGLIGMLMIPWFIYGLNNTNGYDYIFKLRDPYNLSLGTIKISDMPLRFLSNLKYYGGKVVADIVFFPYFREVTFGDVLFPVKIFLSVLFSALFISGFYRCVRKNAGIIELYIIIYIVMLMFWTYHDERFLLPIYPFLLGYLMIILRRPKLVLAKKVIVSALFLALIPANIVMARGLADRDTSPESSFFETMSWVKENTPPAAIILSCDPVAVYLYSQRKGATLELEPDARKAFSSIRKNKIDYIVAWKYDSLKKKGKAVFVVEDFLYPLLEKYPDSIKLAYESSGKPIIYVYKIDMHRR